MRLTILVINLFILSCSISAQNLSGVVNQYAPALIIHNAEQVKPDSITIAAADISKFKADDTVLVIQMKAKSFLLNGTNLTVDDAGYAGKYELIKIAKITGNTLIFNRTLTRDGTDSYSAAEKVQVIKVPSLYNANIDANDTLNAAEWNGSSGGVIALIVRNTLTVDGVISATGKGYRGAIGNTSSLNQTDICNINVVGNEYEDITTALNFCGLKGEGIFEAPDSIGRGAGEFINGGGGAVGFHSGGGGGSNGGAGGQGGTEASPCYNAGNILQAFGGRNITSSIVDVESKNKIFLGGGGGSGVAIASYAVSSGANGGGIIILIADEITGNGKIESNGQSLPSVNGGGGGGGAGGTIVLDFANWYGNINVIARGTDGAKSSYCTGIPGEKGGGSGGGGGGGFIVFNTASIPVNVHVDLDKSSGGGNCNNISSIPGGVGDTLFNSNIIFRGMNFNAIPDSQVICSGDTAIPIIGSTPKGSSIVPSYAWEKSTNLIVWTPLVDITKDYTPTEGYSITTYYRRIVTMGVSIDTSNIHTVKVYPAITGNTLLLNPTKICLFDSKKIKLNTTIAINGGVPYVNPNYTWYSKTGVNWTELTEESDSLVLDNPNKRTEFKRFLEKTIMPGKCNSTSAVVILDTLTNISNNKIGVGSNDNKNDTLICQSQAPGNFIGKTPLGGTSTFNYQWQRSTKPESWTNLSALANFTSDTLHQTSLFRRLVTSDVCSSYSDTISVTVLDSITNADLHSDYLCIGDTIIETPLPIGGDNTFQYNWEKSDDGIIWTTIDAANNFKQNLNVHVIDTFYLRRQVSSGPCKYNSKEHVFYPFPYSKIIGLDLHSSEICYNDSMKINIKIEGIKPYILYSNANSFHLNKDSSLIFYLATTNQFIVYSLLDSNQCKADTSGMSIRNYSLYPNPTPQITTDSAVCGLSTLKQVTHTGGTGNWLSNDSKITFSDNEIIAETYGHYEIIYREKYNICNGFDTLRIGFYEMPNASILSNDTTMYYQFSHPIEATTNVGIGSWEILSGKGSITNPYSASTKLENLSQGETIIQWKVVNGACSISDLLTILINDFKIPGGFSPNNDNINDTFEILGIENTSGNELTIFSNWGGVVFQSSSYKNDWDGSNNGVPLPEDNYYYVLKTDGKVYKGIVVIKR